MSELVSIQEVEVKQLFEHENRISKTEKSLDNIERILNKIEQQTQYIPDLVAKISIHEKKLGSLETQQSKQKQDYEQQCRECDRVKIIYDNKGQFLWYILTIVGGVGIGMVMSVITGWFK